MKTSIRVLAAMGLCLLVGCATGVKTTDIAVRVGMFRDNLKLFFGEPLRIEAGAAGAEDWYVSLCRVEDSADVGVRDFRGARRVNVLCLHGFGDFQRPRGASRPYLSSRLGSRAASKRQNRAKMTWRGPTTGGSVGGG